MCDESILPSSPLHFIVGRTVEDPSTASPIESENKEAPEVSAVQMVIQDI